MPATRQHIQYFLFSQHLADGIRITLGIILPVIVFAQTGRMDLGMIMASGALCVSITDTPGPVEHKRNGMLYCNAFLFGMSLLTGLMNQQVWLLGLLVAVASFFFTMFSVYGNRAGLVGTAALLIMILRMPVQQPIPVIITESLFVLAGGCWYLLITLIFFRLTPYRPAQRSLGDGIHEIAKYVRIKAELYDTGVDYETAYRNLLSQQVVISEKQDAMRELLFKDKDLMKEPTKTGKLLVVTFADSIDLYEQVMASWYDYTQLREKYAHTGILQEVSAIIRQIADELDRIGLAIQSNSSYTRQFELIPALDTLKAKIDAQDHGKGGNLVLKKILVNLRNLNSHINELSNYFSASITEKGKLRRISDYARFVSHQEIDPVIIRNNLTLESGVFRHALRMMITCTAGFVITSLVAYGQHSYWVLLTTIVILKPAFSLTRQRNIQRLTGTFAGGILGVLLLYYIQDRTVLYALLIFFMVGTYTFQRSNYIVMVIFITPYILILFNLLGLGLLNVAQERLIDTAIASALAFTANYLLFPHWESVQLQGYMIKVLQANIGYLKKLQMHFCGHPFSLLEYKLVRKEIYTSTANLSAAFERMLSEPKSKQPNGKLIYEFMVLNNVLSSNIAGISANFKNETGRLYPKEITSKTIRAINTLQRSLQQTDPSVIREQDSAIISTNTAALPDKHLSEQIDFIVKVTIDIEKVTKAIFK